MSWRAFGGGELAGVTLARCAYMDEAGISEHEPFVVVAAVMVNQDRQIKGLEAALEELAEGCVGPEKAAGFIFHAKDLYHGIKTLDRETYPRDHRLAYLDALVNIPADNDMEVAMHFIEKAQMTGDFRPDAPRERQSLYHAMAYIGCAASIEMIMRRYYPDEVCQIIAEDNTQTRALIREAHAFLQDKGKVAGLPEDIRGILPLTHVVHAPFFAAKRDAPGLQVADACAFSIRRHLEGRNDPATYYDPLKPALCIRPKTDADLAEWDARRDAKRAEKAERREREAAGSA